MFLNLLKRTILPFGIPLVLVLAVFFLARNRFSWLKRLPGWLWITIILAIIVLWVVVIAWGWWSARRRARAIEQGILKQAQWNVDNATPARRGEIEEVRKNLAEAITMLRNGPDGRRALYTLPWYMIIGPPAIGKTTAIVNSGLNFPGMTTARRMRGAGGTRNCDWWFSTDAILLDTAGRYAQSSDRSETEGEWFAFLDLLRRNRGRGPINGLILGYSIETLADVDETRLINDARELRQRMDEILDRLGWTFPVYVLFTKCDLIAGFADYFSALSPVERQQVWGATHPLETGRDQKAAGKFLEEFDALCRRLKDLRIRRMASLDRGDAWGRTFMFPEEFSGLRSRFHLFIETLFEPNPFRKDSPLFRGTYFSSGKQVGKPFDLVVRKIQALLGSGVRGAEPEAQPEKEDAYFVRDLFARVLKGDRDLVRRTRATGARWARIQLFGSAGLLALSLLSCLWVAGSCTRLSAKMTGTRGAVEAVQKIASPAPDAATLATLDQLREKIRKPWAAFPLTVALDVRESARTMYLNAARRRVLEPIEENIASDLDSPRSLDADQVRRALRAELLMLAPRDRDNIGAPADLSSVLAGYGFGNPAADSPARKHLDGLVDEFLRAGQPLRDFDSRRSEVVSGARRLDETHAKEDYFRGLVTAASRCGKDLDLHALAGDQSILKAGDDVRVRAAFTRSGWKECLSGEIRNVKRTMEADQALMERAGFKGARPAPTEADLLGLYVGGYADEWGSFLAGIRLKSYSGCADAVGDLKELKKRKGSPLLRLLEAAGAEARLDEGLLGSKDLEAINRDMRPLTSFLEGAKDQPAPIDDYAKSLADVYDQISACAEDPKARIDGAVLRKAREWVTDYVDRFAAGPLASPLSQLLQRPILITQGVAVSEGKGKAQEKFQEEVAGFVQDRLAGKYPFGGGDDMATPEDIVAIFGAGGRLEAFEASLSDAGEEPSAGLKAAVEKAAAIRGALKMSGDVLKASFTMEGAEVRLIEGVAIGPENDRRIAQVKLTINGTSLVDQRTGSTSKTFNWSSDDENTECALALEYPGHPDIASLEFNSLWAVCQLFDAARRSGAGGSVKLTWAFPDEGIEVDFLLTMRSGAECPFLKGSAFRNIARILPGSVVN